MSTWNGPGPVTASDEQQPTAFITSADSCDRHGEHAQDHPRCAPKRRSVHLDPAFSAFRFPPEIIARSVPSTPRNGLSCRDVEERLAERGIEVDDVTAFRWVQRLRQFDHALDEYVHRQLEAA